VGTIHRPTPYQDVALPLSYGGKFIAAKGLEPLRETSMRRTGRLPHSIAAKLAEAVRFELTDPFLSRLFSRQVQ